MRLTQMLAVLNGEVPYYEYDRLSHYSPNLYWSDHKEDEQMDSDEILTDNAEIQALINIRQRLWETT